MIDRRKKYMIVIDVETCGSFSNPIVYDIGYAICDKKGNIYEKNSIVISELFFDKYDLLRSAYYAEKLPYYYNNIGTEFTLLTFENAKQEINNIMKLYGVTEVWAYNCNFDKNALDNTNRFLTSTENFFETDITYHCIWRYAVNTILQQKMCFSFAKDYPTIAISDKGNMKTSAEFCYSYMINKPFEEKHTGLQDVLIECAILARCIRQHKSVDTTPKRNCWRVPQEKFRNYMGM